MPASTLPLLLRAAGLFQFATLGLACLTPIPPDWDANLARLPLVHRRFAQAQNLSIGAMIATLALFSLLFPTRLVSGDPLARAICVVTALFWGGRLALLPWMKAHTCLVTPGLKAGFALLLAECAAYAAGFGWLAIRTPAH